MKKYLTLISLFWQTQLVYRFNFSIWRLRNVFMFLSLYYLWTVVFQSQTTIFGYSKDQMLTYVFLTAVLKAVILSTQASSIANDIQSGDLSNLLVKPISTIKYYFAKDLADKGFNILFSSIEIGLLYLLFKPHFIFPNQGYLWFSFLLFTLLAFVFNFFLNYLIGLWSFWVLQIWPIMFLTQLFSQIVSGGLFPLNIFPVKIYQFLTLTPFPYLIYFPTAIFLGKITSPELFRGLLVISLWITVTGLLVRFVWHKGSRNYSSFGH